MKHLSIEELEKCWWEEPKFDSYVTRTSYSARKKPLAQLSAEEIRLLLGQKIGLKYVIPLGISILKENVGIMVQYYEGDLLNQFLGLDINDWEENYVDLKEMQELVLSNQELIYKLKDVEGSNVEKFIHLQ